MESFRTMFRLVVMSVALFLGYKGWQLCGPPVDRLKSFAQRTLEIAQSALGEEGQPASGAVNHAADPQVAMPAPAIPGPVMLTQTLVPAEPAAQGVAPAGFAPPELMAVSPPTEPLANPTEPARPIEQSPEADLAVLYERLEQLGVHGRDLAQWGSSGQMYRFGCQAAVGDSPDFSRHFESFAAEPRAAVEEVLVKVEAWRSAQRGAAQAGATVQ